MIKIYIKLLLILFITNVSFQIKSLEKLSFVKENTKKLLIKKNVICIIIASGAAAYYLYKNYFSNYQNLNDDNSKDQLQSQDQLFLNTTDFAINKWPPANKDEIGEIKIEESLSWKYQSGYWFLIDEKEKYFILNEVCDYDPYDNKVNIDLATQLYKIHLMPKNENFLKVINQLLTAIKKDGQFKILIRNFKIVNNINDEKIIFHRMPFIVIYSSLGKENAQKLLNKIYELFKNEEGSNINPRWNEKVTSLIYFAQGGGDYKKIKANLFEDGDDDGNGRVYFKPDVTGKIIDYHLENPTNIK